MVGLPYPDKRDPELKQKMAYLDEASPGRYEMKCARPLLSIFLFFYFFFKSLSGWGKEKQREA